MNKPLARIMLVNNLREYLRDFTSSFFTFVFPLIFVVIFFFQTGEQVGGGHFVVFLTGDASPQTLEQVSDVLEEVPILRVSPHEIDGASEIVVRQNTDGSLHLKITGPAELEPALETIMLAGQGAAIADPVFDYAFEPRETKSLLVQLLPAFFGMSLLQLGLFGTSMPLLAQRSSGVFRHLRTLPIEVTQIVTSLAMTRLLMAALQMVGLYLIATVLFGFTVEGSLLWFIAFLVVGTLCFVSMGFAIGGAIDNFQVGNLLVLGLNFLMLGLGNVFFVLPPDSSLNTLAQFLPITYLTDGLRFAATGLTFNFAPVLSIGILGFFTVMFSLMALRVFHFDMERRT